MIPHIQTTEKFFDANGNVTYYHFADRMNEAIQIPDDSDVVFVSFFGSYQTGKSTTISILTGDLGISIGDGIRETTEGAFIYGPYFLNTLKSNFRLSIDPTCNTYVFFVDTEGFAGFESGQSIDENTLLITQLIAPYIALSSVSVTSLKHNITNSEVEMIKTMLSITRRVEFESQKRTPIIGMITDVKSPQNSDIIRIIESRFQEKIFEDIIPLSEYNPNNKPLEQGEEFQSSFKNFASVLFNHISESNKRMKATEVVNAFKLLVENTRKQNLDLLISQTRFNNVFDASQRIYGPVVQSLINRGFKQLQEEFENYEQRVKSRQIISTTFLKWEPIFDNLKHSMDELLPQDVKDISILYQNFTNKIQISLQKRTNEYNENILEIVYEPQIQYLRTIVDDFIEHSKQPILESICSSNENLDLSNINFSPEIEQMRICCIEKVNQEFQVLLASNAIQTQILYEIEDKISETRNELLEVAQNVIKVNWNNTSMPRKIAIKAERKFGKYWPLVITGISAVITCTIAYALTKINKRE